MNDQERSFASIVDLVREFHEAFEVNCAHQPTAEVGPTVMDLRHRLMAEENDEYLEAAQEGDIVGVADALGDQLYILCGTILTHGLQQNRANVGPEVQIALQNFAIGAKDCTNQR